MVALSARTGGSRHTGLAALPHENNQLAEKKSPRRLEAACAKALQYSNSPSYKSIKNILATDKSISEPTAEEPTDDSAQYGITRGARHYGGNRS